MVLLAMAAGLILYAKPNVRSILTIALLLLGAFSPIASPILAGALNHSTLLQGALADGFPFLPEMPGHGRPAQGRLIPSEILAYLLPRHAQAAKNCNLAQAGYVFGRKVSVAVFQAGGG